MVIVPIILGILGAGIGGAFVGAVAQASHDVNREAEYYKFWNESNKSFQKKLKNLSPSEQEELRARFTKGTDQFLNSYTREQKLEAEEIFNQISKDLDDDYLNPNSNRNLEKELDPDVVDLVNKIFSFIKPKEA